MLDDAETEVLTEPKSRYNRWTKTSSVWPLLGIGALILVISTGLFFILLWALFNIPFQSVAQFFIVVLLAVIAFYLWNIRNILQGENGHRVKSSHRRNPTADL